MATFISRLAGRAESVISDHTLRVDLTPSDLADLAWAFANLFSGSLLLRRRPALSLQKRHPIVVTSAHESSYELSLRVRDRRLRALKLRMQRCILPGASIFIIK